MATETPVNSAVIHGYYRYTDILWEWQKVLPEELVNPMRSFIHSESMTSPGHPFFVPGLGVELYQGTLTDNEIRLMFSSKQIEYLRYWVKTMGLVDPSIPFPLPHSDCLLTSDSLKNVSTVRFLNAADIKSEQKKIDKLNRRLRGAVDETLAAVRQLFERTRTAYGARRGTWIACDFEAWERAHEVVTEFGYAIMKWVEKQPDPENVHQDQNGSSTPAVTGIGNLEARVVATGHWIVDENSGYRNGQFCPDNRDRFAFGTSEMLPLAQFRKRITDLISPSTYSPGGNEPLYLVFHDHNQDLETLVNPKYKLQILPQKPTLILPEQVAEEGIFVVDTAQLFAALEGESQSRRSLEDVYRRLTHKQHYDYHNAGNDAMYTLMALQQMASGKPLDSQREERWPPPPVEIGQPTTKRTMKVVDWKEEDESEYEDMQAVLRPDNFRPLAAV